MSSCFALTFRSQAPTTTTTTGIAAAVSLGRFFNVDIHVEEVLQACWAATITLALFGGRQVSFPYPITWWLLIDGLDLRAHVLCVVSVLRPMRTRAWGAGLLELKAAYHTIILSRRVPPLPLVAHRRGKRSGKRGQEATGEGVEREGSSSTVKPSSRKGVWIFTPEQPLQEGRFPLFGLCTIPSRRQPFEIVCTHPHSCPFRPKKSKPTTQLYIACFCWG